MNAKEIKAKKERLERMKQETRFGSEGTRSVRVYNFKTKLEL